MYCSCPGSLSFFPSHLLLFCNCLCINSLFPYCVSRPCSFTVLKFSISSSLIPLVSQRVMSRIVKKIPSVSLSELKILHEHNRLVPCSCWWSSSTWPAAPQFLLKAFLPAEAFLLICWVVFRIFNLHLPHMISGSSSSLCCPISMLSCWSCLSVTSKLPWHIPELCAKLPSEVIKPDLFIFWEQDKSPYQNLLPSCCDFHSAASYCRLPISQLFSHQQFLYVSW